METNIILDFLRKLSENNTREWYQGNKDFYLLAKRNFEGILETVISGIYSFDKDIGLLQPKDCVFRIFRDVRFSANKLPYKTNFGAFIARGGKKSGKAGYYFHLEPGKCFIAGGIYMPEPTVLKAVRKEIFNYPEEYLEIVDNEEFNKVYPHLMDEDKLKKPPRDFPKDFEHIELLKHRSYTFWKEYPDSMVLSGNYPERVISDFSILRPFISFINNAIENN